ncbi:hypothetical protein CAEBREN_09644 [Caenorhabditis brenneri]|uniref:Uncharacterized protein n=1 Tax=Caenorhabditis brenneri TaxID=135651 RepID=G0MS31_CAEBE|nr:hypothetical protein CAEBREN_09644 [Caenorhabditis brenneri]
MSILYVQHIIADIGWIGQRVLLVMEDYTDPFDSEPYIYLSKIRAFCLFLGLSILPCLIMERFYATCHLTDYESKRRVHIFYVLLALLIVIGIITSYTYHEYESSLCIFIFLMSFCSLGILCTRQRRSIQPYTTEEPGTNVVLKNSFGQVMTDFSSDAYFRQLKQSWS